MTKLHHQLKTGIEVSIWEKQDLLLNKPIMKLANAEKNDLVYKKGGNNMKNLLHQILVLEGIYFIISLIFSFMENDFTDIIIGVIYVTFFIFFIVLSVKKHFTYLQKIINTHKKTTNYLVALGCVE